MKKIMLAVTGVLIVAVIVLQIEIVNLQNDHVDEIQNIRITKIDGGGTNEYKNLHFSVDDTMNIFEDITDKQYIYRSIFDNETLAFFKELHIKYGLVVTMYCYGEFSGFSLKECTDKFQSDFQKNQSWLKFAFHAGNDISYENTDAMEIVSDYREVTKELSRITGVTDYGIDTVRLDRFAGTYEQINALKSECGINVFLAADQKDRQSYFISTEENELMYKNDILEVNGIYMTPTDIRIENIESNNELEMLLSNNREELNLVVFTHEWMMDDKKVKKYIEEIAEFAVKNDYKFTESIVY